MDVRIRRAYEGPRRGDGFRVLVDRVWPRGLRKEDLALDAWWRDLAPSTGLRKWFAHDPERFDTFRKRYLRGLDRQDHPGGAVDALLERARRGRVTLLFGARDTRHNQAVVLREYLQRRLGG